MAYGHMELGYIFLIQGGIVKLVRRGPEFVYLLIVT